MKKRYFLLILIVFAFSYVNVDASSIDYNLTIDSNLHFYENIIYKVNKSELDTSGNYDFMTSIVNDKIYFDNDESVPYTKTSKLIDGQYTVTLKNDYAPLFFTGSRIINECFSKFTFEDNEDKLYAYLESPFYCLHRADTIKINIITDLTVNSSNADSINGNIYTWNVDSKNFNLKFSAAIPVLQDEPMDGADEGVNETTDADETTDEDIVESINDNENTQKNTISIEIFVIIGIVIVILSVIVFIFLKLKKNNLDQI